MQIINPATEAVIADVAVDTSDSVTAKLARLRRAQPAWAARPLSERLATIAAFRERVRGEVDALALTLTREMGKPIGQAKGEINALVADGGRLDFFLRESEAALADREVHRDGTLVETIVSEPLGVVANISAWNYPWFVGSNAFVPALIAGNAVAYKPSEHTTLTGLKMAALLHASGVPEDVFVPLVGAGEVGRALVEAPVDGVFFTGSYATGKAIVKALSNRMLKVQLELGGKDPTYVMDDADPEAAAESLADGAMYNAGQSCCSVERIYVHEAIAHTFIEAFIATVRGFVIGDPEDPRTYLGPLARADQLEVLATQVRDAVARGAVLALGGGRITDQAKGYWFEPTVLLNVDHGMQVMREESFGPIIGIQIVKDDDQALALMNDTAYGLTAGVYGRDEARARRILGRVQSGSVYFNCCDRVSPRLPWSGRGHSGSGTTLSTAGIQTFTQPKAWHFRGA